MSTRTGPLDPVKLFKIFRSLMEQKLTGLLVLSRGQIVKRVRLVDGLPMRVLSNARRESAIAALQEQGFLEAADVERVNAAREAQRLTADDALIALGYLDVPRLRALEARLGRRRLLELFTWREGEYTFTPSSLVPEPTDEVIDLVPVLVEAAGRVTTDADCQAFVDQFKSQLVRLTPWAETHGAAFDAIFGAPNTRQVLARPSTPEELVVQLRDRERVARQVFTLVISGLAVFHRQGTAAEQAAPRTATGQNAPPTGPAPIVSMRTQSADARQARPVESPPRHTRPPEPAPAAAPAHVVRPAPVMRPATAPVAPPAPERPAAPAAPARAPKALDEKARAALVEVKRIHEAMRRQTHYELLGVEKNAPVDKIRTQFRKMARDYHADRFARFGLPPDPWREVQEVFMAINRAHEILSDVDKRKEYDLQIEMGARGQRPSSSGGSGHDVGAIFRAETLIRDGTMLLRNGNAAAAKVKLEEALAATPADVVARAGYAFAEFLLATAANQRAAADTAVARLEEVASENEVRDEPFLYLGRVHRTRGHLDKAMTFFKRALDVNPRCAEAASELRHLQRKAEAQPAEKSQSGLFGRKKA